jgi:hypothetical protein
LRLDLAQIATLAGSVWRIAALAHHALKSMPFGHLEERLAVIEGLDQVQAGHLGTPQQPFQPSPAFYQGQRPEVLAA